MLLSETVHPDDPQVGHQCSSDECLALTAAPRQRGPSDQVGLGPRVTCSVLRMAESHQEIGSLRLGSVQRLGRIERDLVVLRRLRRSEVLEGVIAGGDRPVERIFGQAGQGAMPGQLQNNVGMETLATLPSRHAQPFRACGHGSTDRSPNTSHWRRARARIASLGAPIAVDQDPRRHGGIESSEHRRFRQIERLEKDVLRELQSENGCGSQHVEHVFAEGLAPGSRRPRGGWAGHLRASPSSGDPSVPHAHSAARPRSIQ